MMKIEVKGWKADQIDADAKRFNRYPDCDYFDRFGDKFYRNADGNEVYHVSEILKETEKAMQVNIETGTVTATSTKGWTTWIPKMAIVSIQKG